MVVQNEMVLEFGSVLEGIFKKFYKQTVWDVSFLKFH